MSSFGATVFQLGYDISPIVLQNGIAGSMPFSVLPIVAITEGINFLTSILSGGSALDLNNFFAHFKPVPGNTLIDQQIGMYPFANQAVAANAVIQQPLKVSMLMYCPAKGAGGYVSKLATMISLQNTLSKHNAMGGLYTVVTPAYFYTNCVMTGMRDVSSGESKQAQMAWQLDFVQPLVTLNQAQQAYNALQQRMQDGGMLPANADGSVSYSSVSTNVGVSQGVASAAILPASGSTPGSVVNSLTGGIDG